MNEILKKFSLVEDKFIPKMLVRQPKFTYSVCGPFIKNIERIYKFEETEDSTCIYQNKLDKACFQHDTTYGDFIDLPRRTDSDKILYWGH